MGSCYWILVWDGWGDGLNMRSPRFLLRVACPWDGTTVGGYPAGYTSCPNCGTPDGKHIPSYLDKRGAERNSWPDRDTAPMTDEEIDEKHGLTKTYGQYWRVLR